MHTINSILLAAAPLLLVARADIDFDGDDLNPSCRAVCQPVIDLSRRCEVDDDRFEGPNEDRIENQLEAQCYCTNDSFDVGEITALCADCIRQNPSVDDDNDDDDDDNEQNDQDRDEQRDIERIMRTCGFASTSYASSASTAAQGITVVATAATATDQLTTTLTGATGTNSAPTATNTNNSNNDDTNDDNNDDNNNNDSNNNNNNDDSNNDSTNNNDDDGSLAAITGIPLTAVLGAFAAGAALLLG